MNKRGSILDMLFLLVILFTFAVTTLVAYTIWDNFSDDTDAVINSSIQADLETNMDTTLSNFDYLFVFLLVGLVIVLVISVFFLKSHPAFFWITMLFMIIVLVVAAVLSNAYEDIGAESELSAANTEYNIIEFVMDRLPMFMLFICAIVILALFAKSRFQEEY